MQTLFPPDYPDRPDAPLLSFGPSFSEEISRSVVGTIWKDDTEDPNDFEIRVAAGLTMLEAFHPRDHLECMLAAQGVGYHCAIMETLRRAMLPDQPEPTAIKLRANASQMGRTFSNLLRDMERRQTKPLPHRPGQAPPPGAPDDPPPEDPADGTPPPRRTRAKPAAAKAAEAPVLAEALVADAKISTQAPRDRVDQPGPMAKPGEAQAATIRSLADVPDLPEDMRTRPDGTPGSLAGYLPKPRVATYIPREAPIMIALATRPKPWRMVNVPVDPAAHDRAPADPAPTEPGSTTSQAVAGQTSAAQSNPSVSGDAQPAAAQPTGDACRAEPPGVPASHDPMHQSPPVAVRTSNASAEAGSSQTGGLFDPRARMFTGDALARFTSARLDPNAPIEPLLFEHEDSLVELELVSAGGDPEAEAHRQAMIAAHPEGRPVVVFRHGTRSPPEFPPDPANNPPDPRPGAGSGVDRDENPPDT